MESRGCREALPGKRPALPGHPACNSGTDRRVPALLTQVTGCSKQDAWRRPASLDGTCPRDKSQPEKGGCRAHPRKGPTGALQRHLCPQGASGSPRSCHCPRDSPHSPSQGKSNLFSLGDNRGGHKAGSSDSQGWASGSHSAADPSLLGVGDTARVTVLASGPGRGLWSGAGAPLDCRPPPSPVTVPLLLVREATGRRGRAMMCPAGIPSLCP